MYTISFQVVVHPKPIEVSNGMRGGKRSYAWVTTECHIDTSDAIPARGETHCSTKDRYDHLEGLLIAFERAVGQLPRDIRKALWLQFFKQTGINYSVLDKIQHRERKHAPKQATMPPHWQGLRALAGNLGLLS